MYLFCLNTDATLAEIGCFKGVTYRIFICPYLKRNKLKPLLHKAFRGCFGSGWVLW